MPWRNRVLSCGAATIIILLSGCESREAAQKREADRCLALFRQIRIDMSRAEVEELLGKPVSAPDGNEVFYLRHLEREGSISPGKIVVYYSSNTVTNRQYFGAPWVQQK